MKYLSWDIGIKNLSYCLTEKKEDTYNILNWEIINLSEKEDPIPICQEVKKNKSQCEKKSIFFNHSYNSYCCKVHSKNFKIKSDLTELKSVKCLHKKNDIRCTKKIYYVNNENKYIGYCSKHFKELKLTEEKFSKVAKKKDKQNEFERISEALISELDERPFLLDVDTVTIENQPAFKNPKMKSIQMIVYTYFLIRGKIDQSRIERILFLSANNKLKVDLFLDLETKSEMIEIKKKLETELKFKDKYKRNKELAKLFCLELLNFFNLKEKWIEIFSNHKKRDDLADTFLMNIYQIQLDNK